MSNNSIYYLSDDIDWFPSTTSALTEPNGLLAVGGDLSSDRVYNAYKKGIFPWFAEDEPIMWWSPDPRAIINIGEVRINKSFRKFLTKCDYSVSINTQFKQVISHCSKPRPNSEGTWILPEMIKCYSQLHQQGKAHSIEIWQINDSGKTLIGGLYGILVGSMFCGESMFSIKANASKLALVVLERLLRPYSNAFIDCQLPNPYLMSMGARLVSRDFYLQSIKKSAQTVMPNSVFSPKFIEWRSLLES